MHDRIRLSQRKRNNNNKKQLEFPMLQIYLRIYVEMRDNTCIAVIKNKSIHNILPYGVNK